MNYSWELVPLRRPVIDRYERQLIKRSVNEQRQLPTKRITSTWGGGGRGLVERGVSGGKERKDKSLPAGARTDESELESSFPLKNQMWPS